MYSTVGAPYFEPWSCVEFRNFRALLSPNDGLGHQFKKTKHKQHRVAESKCLSVVRRSPGPVAQPHVDRCDAQRPLGLSAASPLTLLALLKRKPIPGAKATIANSCRRRQHWRRIGKWCGSDGGDQSARSDAVERTRHWWNVCTPLNLLDMPKLCAPLKLLTPTKLCMPR